MQVFYAPTEDIIISQVSELAENATAGSNVTLVLKNNTGATENGFVVIGTTGEENAELEQINQAVSGGTSIRVATLARDHKAGEKVSFYRFNQRKFYGCATQTGSYVELSGSPVNIGVDNPKGTAFAYSGTSYAYLKATYYNSQDATETDLADSSAVMANQSRRYATISDIRSRAGLERNLRITDGEIERARIRAESAINSALCNRYVLPMTADPIPAIINTICEDWAAGWLLMEKEIDKEGKGEIYMKSAKQDLADIASGKTILIGVDGLQISASNRVSISGFPDGGVLDTTERMFTVDQKF